MPLEQESFIERREQHPKVLFIDIETLPNQSYTWAKYQQDVIEFMQESCIATFAASWLHEDKVFAKALPDYKGYKPGSYDDAALVKDLWKLLDEADIVVAHNGDSFDIKVIQSRFIVHSLPPPSPFKTVDTKKVAKEVGRFNSNKLDDLGELLHEGRKIKTDFSLWRGCIHGDMREWRKMVCYNKKDVALLKRIYLRFRGYMSRHPNYAVYRDEAICPKCGSKDIQFRGYAMTSQRRYRSFQCKQCGGWGRKVMSDKQETPRANRYTNAV